MTLHALLQDLHQHTVLPTPSHLYIISMHHYLSLLTASLVSNKTKEEDGALHGIQEGCWDG